MTARLEELHATAGTRGQPRRVEPRRASSRASSPAPGPTLVRQVITLGSPFGLDDPRDSRVDAAYRRLGRAARQPELTARPRGLRRPIPVPTTAVYSRLDGVVPWRGLHQHSPARTARTSPSTAATSGWDTTPRCSGSSPTASRSPRGRGSPSGRRPSPVISFRSATPKRPDRSGDASARARRSRRPRLPCARAACCAEPPAATHQLAHPLLDAVAEHVDVGDRVVVAGDAEEEAPAVREDRDADANAAHDRDVRVRVDHPAPDDVERVLRAGDVRGHRLERTLRRPRREPRTERRAASAGRIPRA